VFPFVSSAPFGPIDDAHMTAQGATRGQPPISRFAPSPTGLLHLGHAYSAVIAHDRARTDGGRFLVRIEDIDGERCRPEFVEAIFDDLRWLGLWWDSTSTQSEHVERYGTALDQLRSTGMIYPCVCTRAEIAASASAPQGDLPPAYPGTCKDRAIAGPAAWRLDMAKSAAPDDPAQAWGDVVIARKDALASYHLAVTIDDAAEGVTDVVRGRDLETATDIHRVLQRLLGLPTPRYHHHALICGPDGNRLAKRAGSSNLAEMRANGIDGQSLAAGLRVGRLPIGFTFDTP
jgi:glutamyl-Q tRNA(Asp) synthetase